MKPQKLILLTFFLMGLFLIFFFDLHAVFTLESLKTHQANILKYYAQYPVKTIVLFALIYIVYTTLSIPSAVILTLSSGAIFGSVLGTLITGIASTIGATLSFILTRFVLRDGLEKRYGDKIKAFNEKIEKEGFFYLLSIRLVPIFPYFVINIVSGLSRMSLKNYVLATATGMLPGTFVYAHAGKQLATITSLRDIGSPGMLGAFALLGLFALYPVIKRRMNPLLSK